MNAFDDGAMIGQGGRRETFVFQLGQNETINRVANPISVIDLRRLWFSDRQERPMFLKRRALLDPTRQ